MAINGGELMTKSNRSSNDQRSDAMNRNSSEYKSSTDNRSVQIKNNSEDE